MPVDGTVTMLALARNPARMEHDLMLVNNKYGLTAGPTVIIMNSANISLKCSICPGSKDVVCMVSVTVFLGYSR